MVSKTVLRRLAGCVCALLLVSAPVLAVDVVTSGADVWKTSETPSHSSFAQDPIPADFFCPGSKAFDGTIPMKGAPIATDPPGVLGASDTIVHRLDDATFDADGVATTRIQLMALSLVGVEPIDVGCAQPFIVTATLAGEQPKTEMRIVRENANGGSYAAPLALNVQLRFAPADGSGRSVKLEREIHLAPAPGSYWTTTDKIGTNGYGQGVLVDTDGDGIPESTMPKASNFVAGLTLAATSATPTCPAGWYLSSCSHCTPWGQNPDWQTSGITCTHIHHVDCCKPCDAATPASGSPVLSESECAVAEETMSL